MYSQKVMEHFNNPQNVGVIENADGIGEEGNPVCGDMMTFYIKVADGRLADVKYKTFGCGAAIAVSSMISTMAIGKTIGDALKISRADVAKELDGLPSQKMHCSNLGADALRKAIDDYLARHPGVAATVRPPDKTREEVYAERFGPPPSVPPAVAAASPLHVVTPRRAGCAPHDGMACCPFCDAEIPGDSHVCEPCGKELAHCPNCNALIGKGAHDCPICGADLDAGH